MGEGFSAFLGKRNSKPFNLEMSVEKEGSAHKTLELRAFFRQFNKAPTAYYQYLRGEMSKEELFSRYPAKIRRAREETLYGPKELGPGADDDKIIHQRLRELRNDGEDQWLVIGGPPCQAYSLVGRARNKGIEGYRAEKDKRHFLYEEYLKVLAEIRPQAFVMENVKGILSSKVNGVHVFPRLLDDLRCPDNALGKKKGATSRYRIYSLVSGFELGELTGSGSDCIIRTEDFGVPQTRHRVILLGIREDVARKPGTLIRTDCQPTVGQMISGLPHLRSGLSKSADSPEDWSHLVSIESQRVAKELKMRGLDPDIAKESAVVATRLRSRGGQFVASRKQYRGPKHLADWIPDQLMGGFTNHETRGHIQADLGRYLFCASYAQQSNGESPKSHDFPDSFAPKHANWASGKFVDRFKVQAMDRPSSTITSHISKDGHYFIHYDPSQCRSLTVREAARLQTFPDNYYFEGNRTQQYVQVGNAVPPWLARQIAQVVYELLS